MTGRAKPEPDPKAKANDKAVEALREQRRLEAERRADEQENIHQTGG